MEEINILVFGNAQKKEIINTIEKINSSLNINLSIKDLSNFSHIQNIEYYFSLINDIQYFNVLILNFLNEKDIINFFELFKPKDYGISKECFPFFMINEKTLPRSEMKKFINNYNEKEEEDYKIQFENILFFNEVKNDFKYEILNIYNCYKQDSKKFEGDKDIEETINILLIGVKNSGKSFLVNKFLGEIRALSMENHYTTKFNFYKHKKYPIVFYDISGFNHNEDNEITNINSKIDEFNKEYKNIYKKIHAIFYAIDCNNVRILQEKEKELIQEILNINIPIYIVGTKAKLTNKQNFLRRTKYELETFPSDYKDKIQIIKDRIFCLDSSKESYLLLLKSVYNEFLLSKNINNKIIEIYSDLNNEELIINKSSSEALSMNENQNNEEKSKVLKIYEYINESIFFNDFSLKIKEVYKNLNVIKEKYLKVFYMFNNLDIITLSNEIEDEFRKIFNEKDLEEIYKLLQSQQKKLIENEKDIAKWKSASAYTTSLGSISSIISFFAFSQYYFLIPLPFIILIGLGFLLKRNSDTRSLIEESVENIFRKFERKYIFLNINIIEKYARNYNQAIDAFKEYINSFEIND